MPNYQAKSTLVLGRQLKVQRLVIPFNIVGSATSVSVVATNDEPGIMFLRTQGVDQITVASGALASTDTATYTVAADDGLGIVNFLVKIDEPVEKICSLRAYRRSATINQADDAMVAALGSTTGVVVSSTGTGQKIMVTVDGELALNAANTLDGCLEIEYIVAE